MTAMTLDLDHRVQLCPHCFHQQSKGYLCERCGRGTMRCHPQTAMALKITAEYEKRMRHGVALPDMRAPRAQ
jgi:hypothetical protein